jgi:hypothetical protein
MRSPRKSPEQRRPKTRNDCPRRTDYKFTTQNLQVPDFQQTFIRAAFANDELKDNLNPRGSGYYLLEIPRSGPVPWRSKRAKHELDVCSQHPLTAIYAGAGTTALPLLFGECWQHANLYRQEFRYASGSLHRLHSLLSREPAHHQCLLPVGCR